ncbi:MAG: PAS domain-containing protein [Bacteroidota bacterium]|jgi:two-component system CheB/CheR fusion protein
MINVLKTKKIKEAIAKDPDKVQDIIDNEKELGICITNDKGIFVTVNPRYLEIYGYTKGEVLGEHFSMMLPPTDAKKLSSRHDAFIENKHEIIRNWEVMNKAGNILKITADAGYSEQIFDKTPHKITFVDYNE